MLHNTSSENKTAYEPKWVKGTDVYESSAQFSECGNYRWIFFSNTGYNGPEDKTMFFKMINPSDGEPDANDATMQAARRIAAFNKCVRFCILNFYPKRSPDVKDIEKWQGEIYLQEMFDVMACNGILVNMALNKLAKEPDKTIFVLACGNYNKAPNLKKEVEQFMKTANGKPIMCLGYNKDGSPMHPLFKAADTKLLNFVFDGLPK